MNSSETTCPTWCVGGPGHDDNEPKVCCTETQTTMLLTAEPSLDWSGTQAASVDLHAEQETGTLTISSHWEAVMTH